MSANEYQFVSRWRVENTIEEVSDVLNNAPDLVRWWPSVYLSVQLKDLENSLQSIPKERSIVTISNHAGRAGKAADLLAASEALTRRL